MNEVERLRQWMKTNGYSTRKLAERMGFTYDGVYQALNVRGKEGRFSPGFKWQFKEAFGSDVADSLFDVGSTEQVTA